MNHSFPNHIEQCHPRQQGERQQAVMAARLPVGPDDAPGDGQLKQDQDRRLNPADRCAIGALGKWSPRAKVAQAEDDQFIHALALARDGLTFRVLGRMSRNQAPVASFVVLGAIACAFVVSRSFDGILRIYFLASAILFGLTYKPDRD